LTENEREKEKNRRFILQQDRIWSAKISCDHPRNSKLKEYQKNGIH